MVAANVTTNDIRSLYLSPRTARCREGLEVEGSRLTIEGCQTDLDPKLCSRFVALAKARLRPHSYRMTVSATDFVTAINHDDIFDIGMRGNTTWLCLSKFRSRVVCLDFENGKQYRGALVSGFTPDAPAELYTVDLNPHVARLLGFGLEEPLL